MQCLKKSSFIRLAASLLVVAIGISQVEAGPASAAGAKETRDHRVSETPVSLKVNQRLLLTNGGYIERKTNGALSYIEMNGRVVKSFPQGKIVKDKSGRVSIISGKKRVQAGQFKAIKAVVAPRRDHRAAPVSLKANQRLLLTNGDYVERKTNGTVNIFEMNGRVVKSFPQGKIVKDKSGRVSIISGKKRVQAGQFKAIKAVVPRRDHRAAPVSLKANQRLLLTNGSYVERKTNGTVNFVAMNGRVVKSFPQGKIVKDKSGGISIISGKKRVQAGQFKAIKTVVPRRDHRAAPVSLKANQRLLLTNGDYVERTANGTLNYVGMNGRVVKSFPQGKIIKDKSGGISIISGKKRVQAGQFKAIKAAALFE